MAEQWMIYGANGYTGELVAREAVRRGLQPILAGRSESAMARLAKELGLSFRVFDCTQAALGIEGMKVVLNCAGPFSATAYPMVHACIHSGVHYVDITGEISVFEMCHELHAQAESADVVLCPGAGFDVVPTDCLAATLKKHLPDANTIDLAFSFGTRPSLGTVLTTVEGMKNGGLVRRELRLVQVANGFRIRRLPFPSGSRWATTIPWGDVFTAGVSTGVQNGMVYTAMPLLLGVLMRLSNPTRGLLATGWVQRRLKSLAQRFFAGGPDVAARASQRTEFWGEAVNRSGKRVSARLSGPNVYALTADTAIELALYCLAVQGRAGYFTPSMLLGAEFITSRPGVEFEWLNK